MKVNLISKVLIGSIALSAGQKASAQITPHLTPITRNIDKFIPSNINPPKTFDILQSLTELLSGNFKSVSAKISKSKNKKGVKIKPKRSKRVSKQKVAKKTSQVNTSKKVKSAQKTSPVNPVKREITSTLDGGRYWVVGKNISYGRPVNYTVPKGTTQKGVKIANANGVSLYRLRIANPNVNFDYPVKGGTTIKIPGRYIITPGTVKSFDDVVKTTGIDKHYIKDILIGIEGRKQKPDLVCKSDNVRSKMYPHGCPTIGFGHTGRVDGEIIVNGKTKITQAKAYELLAQDILDAKVDALVYMSKSLFNNAPASVQTGIIDVVFNKGVEAFDRAGSPTRFIKKDLEKKDYASAAAHTVLKTASRGLKKRNVYRVIMSTEDLSQAQRNKALKIAKPHYINTLSQFPGQKFKGERAYMQRAWNNAQKNGKTYDFFGK
ncbi:hypothetical protein J6O86_08285 [bacterium]|nr:hypothetical protein [bacterium]